jgi:pyruvate/2-oxoglutarate dehydrogenase complex dihydrolipoamide dehydrogenase (E3) component
MVTRDGLLPLEVRSDRYYKLVTMDRLLPAAIDAEISRVLEESMVRAGVDLRLGQPVRALRKRSDGVAVVTDAGEEVFDEIVMGLGVRPNADLAVSAGVKLGQTGAVETDEFMRTNVEGRLRRW